MELTDDEYQIFLGMLSVGELRLEVERQRREAQFAEADVACTRELVTRWADARATLDASPRAFSDHVHYEAQKVVAQEHFNDAMALVEDLYGDLFA